MAQAAVWLGASLPRSIAGVWHWRDVSATVFIHRASAMLPRTSARLNSVAGGRATFKIKELRQPGIEKMGQVPCRMREKPAIPGVERAGFLKPANIMINNTEPLNCDQTQPPLTA
jgi:hypothetical protein